jgi:aspartate carbamoyltransferase catalytic subunit
MEALGGRVVDLGLKERTSIAKGETMSDTIRMLDGYRCDCIVLRHSLEGAAKLAASVSETPIVNAGDGSREHPTQALLDLYTMWREFGRIDNLSVGIVGDLKYGRTPSSLLYALSLFENCRCYLAAPEPLQMRESVLSRVRDRVTCHLTDDLKRVIPKLDVLYVTRIQQERFPDPEEYDRVKDIFQVNAALLKDTSSEAIVMHPLPRTSELSKEVDELPNARYFLQASNGLYVRMALLSEIMGLHV